MTPHLYRACILAALVGSGACCSFASEPGPGIKAAMNSAVQAALQKKESNTQLDRSKVLAAAENACALTGIQLRADENDNMVATVRVTGEPLYNVSDQDNGMHVVLELKNTVSLPDAVLPGQGKLIKKIRTEQLSVSPQFITRATFDLGAACSYSIERLPSCVLISLAPKNTKVKLADAKPVRIEIVQDPRMKTIVAAATVDSIAGDLENLSTPTAEDSKKHVEQLAAELKSVANIPFQPARTAMRRDAAADAVPTTGPNNHEPHDPGEAPFSALKAKPQSDDTDNEPGAASAVKTPADTENPGNSRFVTGGTTIVNAPTATANVPGAPTSAGAGADNATGTPAATPAGTAATPPATTAPGTATAPELPAAPPAEQPAPPRKREEMSPKVSEANQAIATKMKNLAAGVDNPDAGIAPAAGSTPVPQELDRPAFKGDALQQLVNIDFREMDLANVVALLAHKAGINIVAGTDLTGTVTANLHNVPLRQAMETALRMNGLGMMEEDGIYHIVPYEEAIASQRITQIIKLENAKAADVYKVMEDIIKGLPYKQQISVSANDSANLVIISGPAARVPTLIDMVTQMDIAKPVLPVVTEAIQLNYATPTELVDTVNKILTANKGKAAADDRARHLIVTAAPAAVEQIRDLIKQLDVPVKQVAIDSMILDVSLQDNAETGVDWLANVIRHQSLRQAALGTAGRQNSDLQQLNLDTNLKQATTAGELNFGILTGIIDWRGVLQAEIRNQNGHLLSNPVVVTVENQPAKIEIAQEIPYIELTQTGQGGSQTSTQFKNVGTTLTVTPRVTHDNHIIADIKAKESNTNGEFNGVPIEDKREIQTTLNMNTGETIYMGGLRKNNHDNTIRKVPILGDVPVLNVLFRQNTRTATTKELMIFLTCRVVGDNQKMDDYHQEKLEDAKDTGMALNAQNDLFHDMIYPNETQDPVWKFRRGD